MQLPSIQILGAFYGLFELSVSLLLRSKGKEVARKDQGTLRLIWIVVIPSMVIAITCSRAVPVMALPYAGALYPWGVAIFISGIVFRAWSIWYLGRFFTVDVAVASDQVVIDTGPYSYIRHPSYLGALMVFLGAGLCMGNILSLILLLLPVGYVFVRRMDVEEAALAQGLGEPYVEYMRKTRRLIPFVY
jgi:protein-S-isoprenylcysteine O-methyltransferase